LENEPALVLNFHRDLRAAWINGLRAFLAVAQPAPFGLPAPGITDPRPGLRLGFNEFIFFSAASGSDWLDFFLGRSGRHSFLALICKYYVCRWVRDLSFWPWCSVYFSFLWDWSGQSFDHCPPPALFLSSS
jgi:hypothetical protein